MYRFWTESDVDYLEENWGKLSVGTIAKKLGRTVDSIQIKAHKIGLGSWIDCSEYMSFNQLMKTLGYSTFGGFKEPLLARKFPIRLRCINTSVFAFVDIDEFWKWAEKNQGFFDFSRLEVGALGKEPDWVKAKRRSDTKARGKRKTPWTKCDDELLRSLLKAYRYPIDEIASRLGRSEAAVKSRILSLGLKERPIKREIHQWTEEELQTALRMWGEHAGYAEISRVLGVSESAIRSKIERHFNKDYLCAARPSYRGQVPKCDCQLPAWNKYDIMNAVVHKKQIIRKRIMVPSAGKKKKA